MLGTGSSILYSGSWTRWRIQDKGVSSTLPGLWILSFRPWAVDSGHCLHLTSGIQYPAFWMQHGALNSRVATFCDGVMVAIFRGSDFPRCWHLPILQEFADISPMPIFADADICRYDKNLPIFPLCRYLPMPIFADITQICRYSAMAICSDADISRYFLGRRYSTMTINFAGDTYSYYPMPILTIIAQFRYPTLAILWKFEFGDADVYDEAYAVRRFFR